MPKNKGKGGKGKRKGKRNKGGDAERAELRFKVFGEEYGQVRRVLGNCRVEVFCFDGKLRMCHVRGKFKKRVWINKDDFVLVGLRDYQDDKGDVIHKYSIEEARLLRSWGEIPADKANFDDDGALSGGEDQVFSEEEEGEEGGAAGGGEESSDESDDELWQPNNNHNVPIGGEDGSSEESSEESEEEDEEDMFAKSKPKGNSKQNTQAILNSFRRNNAKNPKGGRGGGRGFLEEPEEQKRGGNRSVPAPTNKVSGSRYNPRGGHSNAKQPQGRQASIDDEIEGL